MQQYYPKDLENDPGREMYYKSSESLPKKNIFKLIKNKSINSDNLNIEQPNLYRENIFSENYNRNDGLSEDLVKKDKKIQELEFKIQQLEFEKDSFKSKMELLKKYERDINHLSLRLKEEHNKNKELIILKNKVDLLEKEKVKNRGKIKDLEIKLFNKDDSNNEGISIDIDIKEENEEEEEEEEEGIKDLNYEEIYKKTLKENENLLNKYKNETLKSLILKHLKNIDDSKIESLFIEMKITEETKITKTLISEIIKNIKL